MCTGGPGPSNPELGGDLKGRCHGNQSECFPWRPPTRSEVTYQPAHELSGVSCLLCGPQHPLLEMQILSFPSRPDFVNQKVLAGHLCSSSSSATPSSSGPWHCGHLEEGRDEMSTEIPFLLSNLDLGRCLKMVKPTSLLPFYAEGYSMYLLLSQCHGLNCVPPESIW